MSTAAELITLLDGRVVGTVRQERDGKLQLTYEDGWRDDAGAYPLSLSMPLVQREHGDAVVRPYLEGLLPDNDAVLARWGAQFHVSARNPFALLAHVGEDCAGAVQFVTPERLPHLLATENPPIRWLSDAEVGERLRELRTGSAAWREHADPGYFSLAGAQAKTALLHQDGRWGVPSGRTPTTHILKPPLGDFEGFAENEHLCLSLASMLGLPTTRSKVMRFDGETAIVVERYDRVAIDGRLVRVHQEDFCQALGVSPRTKYEAEGGPGVGDIARVLRNASTAPEEDVATLVRALALNWVIAGTDAHAKNFSILLASGQVRLAPLYDIASVLPYPRRVPPRSTKMAMRVGREYHLREIERRNWLRLANEIAMDGETVVELVRGVVREAPERMAAVRSTALREGLDHPVAALLEDGITSNSKWCLTTLERG